MVQTTMDSVPVIDLQGDRQVAVQTLDFALRNYGFFYVTNHGIDPELMDRQFGAADQLFQLPAKVKESMPFNPLLDIGYVGSGLQSLDPDDEIQAVGDTKEQFMMTNNVLITSPSSTVIPGNVLMGSQNYEPPVPGYMEMARDYASAAYRLNQQLNDLLFDALQLDDQARQALGSNPFIVLKQMKYAGEISNPEQGKFGAGAHTDWGSFTILATDSTPGLQIQMEDGRWLPVPPRPSCLIINSGDQISHLTNSVYRSSMHRVVTTRTTPRFSTAVFTYFNLHAEVGPLPQFLSEAAPALFPLHRTTLEYFHFKLNESMKAVIHL